MSKNKVNPHRIPRTEADCEKARQEGRNEVIAYWIANVFTALGDKHGWDHDQLVQLWHECEDIRASQKWSHISMKEINEMLKEEYEIYVK